MEALREKPFFFEHEGFRLFAMLHEPLADTSAERRRGVVFCSPLAEEAEIAQKVSVDFARALVERGYHVLRFNYRGCGDSEGDFEDVTLSRSVADIRKAVELLRKQIGDRVGLFGLRLGATLAAMAATNDPKIEALILWEPIVDMKNHMMSFLRMQVMAANILAGRVVETRQNLIDRLNSGQGVDVLAYPLSTACFNEFLAVDVAAEVGGEHGPTLLAAIGPQKRRRKDLELLARAYERRHRPVKLLQVRERPFWVDPNDTWRELRFWQGHEGLFGQTIDWLDEIGEGA